MVVLTSGTCRVRLSYNPQHIQMMNNQNPSGNQSQPLSNLIQSIPIFYKFIAICTLVTGLFSLVTNLFVNIFANYPYYTIFYLNLWRFFTSFLVAQGLITAAFSLLVLWFLVPLIERNISTVMMAVDMFVNNAAIQVVYCLVWLLVYLISSEYALNMGSVGIWGVWMVLLARICESDPNGDIKFCCLPFTIKKKFYPLAILVIFAILTFSVPLDMLIGYLVGFIQCKFLNGTLIRLQFQQYQALEDSFLFRCVSHRFDFIRLSESNYAQMLCRESQSSYTEFYGNFVGKVVAGQNQPNPQQNQQQGDGVNDNVGSANFDNMKGGVVIGETQTQQKQDANNVRKYWENVENQSPTKQSSSQAPPGYAVFVDEN